MKGTRDKDNAIVKEGDRVKVLDIKPSVLDRLSPDEARDVSSMRNEVLEVYEIDEWGAAWVKKWWKNRDGSTFCHALSLAPSEMELVKE